MAPFTRGLSTAVQTARRALRSARDAGLHEALRSEEPRVIRGLAEVDGPWGAWGSMCAHVRRTGDEVAAARSLVGFVADASSRAVEAGGDEAAEHVRVELGGTSYADAATDVRDDVPLALAAGAVLDFSAQQRQQQQAPQARPPYVAQSPVPPSLRALNEGLCALADSVEVYAHTLWLGPAGTVSPLHRDPHCSLLAQVGGSKLVRCYAPDASVYAVHAGSDATAHASPGGSLSPVDVECVDAEAFPEFPAVPYATLELRAGDVLVVPARWWHHVRCTRGPSLSLGWWYRMAQQR